MIKYALLLVILSYFYHYSIFETNYTFICGKLKVTNICYISDSINTYKNIYFCFVKINIDLYI